MLPITLLRCAVGNGTTGTVPDAAVVAADDAVESDSADAIDCEMDADTSGMSAVSGVGMVSGANRSAAWSMVLGGVAKSESSIS